MVEKNVKIACYHVEVVMNNLANCPKSVTDRLIVSDNDLIWEIGYQIVFKYLEIVGKLKRIGYRYGYRRYSNAHSIAIVLLSLTFHCYCSPISCIVRWNVRWNVL